MNAKTAIDVVRLALADAHELSPLVAAYVQDMRRGAPRRPDDFYAEMLLQDRAAELVGARIDGRMVGFAVFYDLPDTMSGRRVGQLEDLFVIHGARGRGVGTALIEALIGEGRRRGWAQIRWMVPEKMPVRFDLAETLAAPSGLRAYSVQIDRVPPLPGDEEAGKGQ